MGASSGTPGHGVHRSPADPAARAGGADRLDSAPRTLRRSPDATWRLVRPGSGYQCSTARSSGSRISGTCGAQRERLVRSSGSGRDRRDDHGIGRRQRHAGPRHGVDVAPTSYHGRLEPARPVPSGQRGCVTMSPSSSSSPTGEPATPHRSASRPCSATGPERAAAKRLATLVDAGTSVSTTAAARITAESVAATGESRPTTRWRRPEQSLDHCKAPRRGDHPRLITRTQQGQPISRM